MMANAYVLVMENGVHDNCLIDDVCITNYPLVIRHDLHTDTWRAIYIDMNHIPYLISNLTCGTEFGDHIKE